MSQDWTFCDGHGHLDHHNEEEVRKPEPGPALHMSRGQFLTTMGLGVLGLLASRSALAQTSFSTSEKSPHVLVSIFLRGGADGLSIVVPTGNDDYYRARPNLAIAKRDCLPITDDFGLHPALKAIHPEWDRGRLALIHAVGSPDTTRSHFEAMRTMEYGVNNGADATTGGWLARYLLETADRSSPLRAVALGTVLPDALRGATGTLALGSLADFRLRVPEAAKDVAWLDCIGEAYEPHNDELAQAGHETLTLLKTLKKLNAQEDKPVNTYPESDLGRGLRDVATLIRAQVGLEIACLDRGAWDTHVTQGTTTGWIAANIADIGECIGAFLKDLGPQSDNVTIVVQTEFGRRVGENAALGTDHGRAGAMLVLGKGLGSKRVLGRWPGLAPRDLDEVGDMRVTTDYRDVLTAVMKAKMPDAPTRKIFPGYLPEDFSFTS